MTVEEWLGKDNQLGIDIMSNKYIFNNENVEEFIYRVSGGNEELADLICKLIFFFGGRTLANRNTGKKATMMNCYSEGYVEDSMESILEIVNNIALTFKSQGGEGLSLSKIRPKGCGINHGQFKSDGIVPFMELFNQTTASISQGGSRKGALLMSLDAWHKEAPEFVTIKSNEGKIQKANLSLEIDDDFMSDVKKYYDHGEVVTRHIIRDYNDNKIEYDVTPINLYKLMMKQAYDWAEPGCIFTNRFRNYNLMEYCDDYNIVTGNPCGEQPLAAKSACDLGSINLSKLVLDPFTAKARFDFEMFGKAIDIAIRALDEIIDENKDNHALPEQKEMSLNYRNIGLGTMGMWDMLCKLKLKYGSQESKDFINMLFGYMFRRAVIASSKLAKEKGAFPKYDSNVLKSTIIKRHFTDEELHKLEIDKYGLRNCSLLSIAPNGSIGSMLNISTGCEPIFQISYKRKTESLNGKDSYYDVYTKTAKQYMDLFHTDKLPDYFVSAGDIDWKDRIDIQAIMQDHIDTAISSTINLPNSATIDEIEQLYLYAWEQGLKGVTIFRDGCKRAGILTTDKNTKKENDKKNNNTMNHVETTKIKSVPHKKLERGMIIKADDNCIGKKRTLRTGCGTLHCEAFFDPDTGQLLETYFSKGSSGGCNQFMIGLSRMISLCARGGVDIYSIVDQLKSSGTCPSYAVRRAVNKDTSLGSSCPVAIGNALIDMYEDMQNEINCDSEDEEELSYSSLDKTSNVVDDRIQDNDNVQNPCPQCGAELVFEGGCNVCKACGWSKCD